VTDLRHGFARSGSHGALEHAGGHHRSGTVGETGTLLHCESSRVMADYDVIALQQFLNEQRMERLFEEISLQPPPPIPTTAEVIAARSWSDSDQRPPLSPDEFRAALDLLERARAAAEEPASTFGARTLPKQVPPGGASGSNSPGGRGSTGGSSGSGSRGGSSGGGRPSDGIQPAGEVPGVEWSPTVEAFVAWAVGRNASPQQPFGLGPTQKLAIVNALLAKATFQERVKHGDRWRDLQAWYYFQVRALQAQGL